MGMDDRRKILVLWSGICAGAALVVGHASLADNGTCPPCPPIRTDARELDRQLVPISDRILLQAVAGLTDERLNEVKATAMLPSEYNVRSQHSGGGAFFGVAGEMPTKVSDKERLDGNRLGLVASPAEVRRFGQHLRGMRLIIVNGTNDVVRLLARDSSIAVVQEAQDATGSWKPIEYIRKCGCGNSYHVVSLEPGYYWEIVAPRYSGTLETKLRFVLHHELHDEEPVYSNEFAGTIDPDQFVRKPGVTEPANREPPGQP